ncbi:hypothetical protein NDN08_001500 [Rhodosorus marinus]|uniref:YchJ-like middle NTF2-like domain-containing protein n=1 Tax=Rhodosorus marinus TaxID=101924 RepID=A0AAV8UV52_9RHOD|nr:hypothetical protein NDN08_001500 [Rhodosorus marinus]
MGLTGWLGFVSSGVSLFKPQKRVSFSTRPVGRTCRTAIPGLEWLLFFGLIKGFGTGNQNPAPPQKDASSDKSERVKPINFDEDDISTEVATDSSTRGAEECKCGSERRYEDCCLPIHLGRRRSETPGDLLKARFSAYAYKLPEYILRSTSVESTDWVSRKDKRKWNAWKEEVQEFCDNTEPLKLEILKEQESESRNRASVVFRVDLKQAGENVSFVEKCLVTWSEFGYSYVDGKLLDVME